jgi:hypothetical protein
MEFSDHLNKQNGPPSGDEAKNEQQRVLNQRNGPNKGKKMDEENNKSLLKLFKFN